MTSKEILSKLRVTGPTAAVLTGVMLILAASASAYTYGDTVYGRGSDGPDQTLFEWSSTQRCAIYDFPDTAARAFRDSQGRVQLIATIAKPRLNRTDPDGPPNRSIFNDGQMWDIGSSNLRRPCDTIFNSQYDAEPGNHDDNGWPMAFWAMDPGPGGQQTIYALIHNEYHAWEHNQELPPGSPNGCDVPDPFRPGPCWFNSITLAKSTDGRGADYNHDQWPAPNHLVASTPYQYVRNTGPLGLRAPTNIIMRNEGGMDYYYTLFRAVAYQQQQAGVCVMRTTNLDDPQSWVAWGDGPDPDTANGWEVTFVNPYPSSDPTGHICAPVSPDLPAQYRVGLDLFRSLTKNTFLDRYVLIGLSSKPDAGGVNRPGIYYATSKNLIDWSERKLIVETPPRLGNGECDGERALDYPSLIDPDSTDRNLSTSGQFNYLYATRVNYDVDCYPNGAPVPDPQYNRDLIRIPVRFMAPARTASGVYPGCQGGFDDNSSTFQFSATRDYDHSPTGLSYMATTTGSATAWGGFTKMGEPPSNCSGGDDQRAPIHIEESDEISFSGAFFFPKTGFWDKVDAQSKAVTFMRLGASNGSSSAISVSVDGDGQVHFKTNPGSSSEIFSTPIAKEGPTGEVCWHQFDITQKLSSSGDRALNSLYVDGQLAVISRTPNWGPNASPIDSARVGIIDKENVTDATLYADQISLGYSQRPPYRHLPPYSDPCEAAASSRAVGTRNQGAGDRWFGPGRKIRGQSHWRWLPSLK